MMSRRRLLSLSLLLFVVLAGQRVGPAAMAQELVPLHEAVEAGEAQVEAVGAAFEPARLQVTIQNRSGIDLLLLPGTYFVTDEPGYAPVVSTEEMLFAAGESPKTNEVIVFSVSPGQIQPSPMEDAVYVVDGRVSGSLLTLVEDVVQQGFGGSYGAQLAVWAEATGDPLPVVIDRLSVPPTEREVQLAESLLAGEEPPPGAEDDRPDALGAEDPVEEAEQVDTGASGDEATGEEEQPISLVTAVVILLAVALAGALVITLLSQLRERQAASPAGVGGEMAGRNRAAVPSPPKRKQRKEKKEEAAAKRVGSSKSDTPARNITDEIVPTVVLRGVEGPYAERTLSIEPGTVITRSPIKLIAVDHPDVASPQALFSWEHDCVVVKDLENGDALLYGGAPLRGRQELAFASEVQLPGHMALKVAADGLWIGKRHHAIAGALVLLTRKELELVALGEEDTSISDPHCLIERDGRDYTIKDLNSTNGVWLDGERLGQAAEPLSDQSSIRLGRSLFTCHLPASVQSNR